MEDLQCGPGDWTCMTPHEGFAHREPSASPPPRFCFKEPRKAFPELSPRLSEPAMSISFPRANCRPLRRILVTVSPSRRDRAKATDGIEGIPYSFIRAMSASEKASEPSK